MQSFKLKTALSGAALLLAALTLSACGQQSAADSASATPEHPLVLTLSHGLSESHTVHQAIERFADEVNEKTDGRVRIRIFPNAQLGSETESMEQVMAGVIAMTKVSSPMLATYNEGYHTFGLPYIFNDTASFYKVMGSPEMRDFFMSTHDDGFMTLTYYTSGARSFYTVDKPIRTPADLKGLKIRVQDMKSQTDMIEAMGGSPVAMGYGDVYTSLQTGIIDGTENNETALTTGKHGEICKVFSLDQHAMIPDALVISSKVWDTIAPRDQQIFIDAATHSTLWHNAAWEKAVAEAVTEAKEKMGVTFVTDIDKDAFREATAGMLKAYGEEYPGVKALLETIARLQEK